MLSWSIFLWDLSLRSSRVFSPSILCYWVPWAYLEVETSNLDCRRSCESIDPSFMGLEASLWAPNPYGRLYWHCGENMPCMSIKIEALRDFEPWETRSRVWSGRSTLKRLNENTAWMDLPSQWADSTSRLGFSWWDRTRGNSASWSVKLVSWVGLSWDSEEPRGLDESHRCTRGVGSTWTVDSSVDFCWL